MRRGPYPNCKGRAAVLAAFNADPNASMRDLAEVCKLTASTVQYHLRALAKMGTITYPNWRRRKQNTSAARTAKLRNVRPASPLTLEERMDAIVKRNLQGSTSDVPQHDVVRHINRPLNMRRGGRAG